MAPTKAKGDLAELKVATDLVSKGYRVAVPFGEDCDYDLIVDRKGELERVQVKYARAQDGVVPVRCRSSSLTNGKVRRTKHYTEASIDWIAIYVPDHDRCFYLPATELGDRPNLPASAARTDAQRAANRHSACRGLQRSRAN